MTIGAGVLPLKDIRIGNKFGILVSIHNSMSLCTPSIKLILVVEIQNE